MHVSAKRSNFALGAIALAVAMLLASCGGEQPSNPTEPYARSQGEAEQAVDMVSPPTRIGLEEQACAEANESGRDDPDYHDKRDLCAQYQAASAARENARLASVQTWIGGAGLLAVIATLIFTGWSAQEAAKSAKQAAVSNDQAREFFAEERRPWLAADIRMITNRPAAALAADLGYEVVVRNVGLTPALNVNVKFPLGGFVERWGATERTMLRDAITEAKKERPAGVALFPGQEPLAEAEFIDFGDAVPISGPLSRFVAGYVSYERTETPGVIHVTPFVWNVGMWFDETSVFDQNPIFTPFVIDLYPT